MLTLVLAMMLGPTTTLPQAQRAHGPVRQTQTHELIADKELDALIRSLEKEDPHWSLCDLMKHLGQRGKEARHAAPVLVKFLHHKNSNYRFYAAYALARIGAADAYVITALKERFLKTQERLDVSAEVAFALARLGEQGHAFLTNYLTDKSERLRILSAFGLGRSRIESKKAVTTLVSCFQSKVALHRRFSTFALGVIGRPAVPELLKVSRGKNKEFALLAVSALSRMGRAASPAIPRILELLNDKDLSCRIAASQALCSLRPGSPDCFNPLVKALTDSSKIVRENIASALKKYRRKRKPSRPNSNTKIDNSVAILADCLSSKEKVLRDCALGVLRDLGPRAKKAAPALAAMTKRGREGEKRKAQQALDAIIGRRSLPSND